MIGTEWNSRDGTRRIIGTMEHGGSTLWEVQTGASRFCDLMTADDVTAAQRRDAANLASATAAPIAPASKPETSLYRFLATLEPMKAGRARKSLERLTRVNGKNAASRATHLERMVQEGWRVSDGVRLKHPDLDGYFVASDWTSYGMAYAEWLAQ